MRRVCICFCVLGASIAVLPSAAQASSKRCGNVNVQLAQGSEGGAVRIVATRMTCKKARELARTCVRGRVAKGWIPVEEPPRMRLKRGRAQVSFALAGGGGCFAAG